MDISHCRTALRIASAEAVKFRFTPTLPSRETAIFARAPPTLAGSSRPTFSCPRVRSRRTPASATAPTRARPAVTLLPVVSDNAGRDHLFLASRIRRRGRHRPAPRRASNIDPEHSSTARRTSAVTEEPGRGSPKATVTGMRKRWGRLPNIFPSRKLKMLPHMPPTYTGMIGWSDPRSIRSMPGRNARRFPFLVRSPSPKMQTRCPSSRHRLASFRDSSILPGGSAADTGIESTIGNSHFRHGNPWISRSTRYRTRRCRAAWMNIGSNHVT